MRDYLRKFAVLFILCTVGGITEAADWYTTFKLAATASPAQLRQAVNAGVNFNIEIHQTFDEDYDYEYEFEFMTPLHAAATKNHNHQSIEFLLSLGLDVNAQAIAGNYINETPLTCAIRNNNNIQVINELLKAGADTEVWNSGSNYSAFHLVASECRDHDYAKAVIDALLRAGGNINSHYEPTREELDEILEHEDPADFRIKWDIDDPFGSAVFNLSHYARDKFLATFTPLMFAVLYDNPQVVDILLDAGADTSLRSMEGKTALDYASALPHNTMLKRSSAFRRLKSTTK